MADAPPASTDSIWKRRVVIPIRNQLKQGTSPDQIALTIALPAIAIVMWAMWAAPKAKKRRLKPGPLLLFKLTIFGFATLAWWLAGQGLIAAIFGVLAAINLLGIVAFRQY